MESTFFFFFLIIQNFRFFFLLITLINVKAIQESLKFFEFLNKNINKLKEMVVVVVPGDDGGDKEAMKRPFGNGDGDGELIGREQA